ncbi:MAG: hypothetical protein LBH01_11595 [Verrucomicrobiales bacterium]|jgi:hypothetical protein|nr:hypothetical protein [Verrucomicrobiales bacterium]
MLDLEQQLRDLKFRPLPAEWKNRILPANDQPDISARRFSFNPWLTAPLVTLWLAILALYCNTPDIPAPSGPPVSYTEFRQITLMTQLQIAMLQNENRLPDCDGPSFSAPKHF